MMKHMTPIAAAAEAVHKGFDVLLGEASAVNSGLMITPAVMALEAHHSWIEGFVLTGAGHSETGLAAARRGMEFCFYAAKTAESEKRVKDWWNLDDDPKAAGRFRGQTRIPCTYSKEKYRFLWPLIVLYDLASEAGVHANPASIAPRLIMEEAIFTLRHQMDREETISRAVHMAVIGHQLYRAFSRILGPCVRDGDLQRQMTSFADEREKELRLGYARHTFKGRVPAKVIIDILTGNKSAMEARFKELVQNCACKARGQAKCSQQFARFGLRSARQPTGDLPQPRGWRHARQPPEGGESAPPAESAPRPFLVGPPGSGKTMLARRLATILPPPVPLEALGVTKLYSITGLLPDGAALLTRRPFRSPHHSISDASVIVQGAPRRVRSGQVPDIGGS